MANDTRNCRDSWNILGLVSDGLRSALHNFRIEFWVMFRAKAGCKETKRLRKLMSKCLSNFGSCFEHQAGREKKKMKKVHVGTNS